jgi:crotonobetainyl-CoA:carnitine CoA-transferase CaiB-like acyl-CoA transferase
MFIHRLQPKISVRMSPAEEGVEDFEQVFSMPTVKEREMLVKMDHPNIGELPLVGSPLKISNTPVEYRLPPPLMGKHTEEVLRELGYENSE